MHFSYFIVVSGFLKCCERGYISQLRQIKYLNTVIGSIIRNNVSMVFINLDISPGRASSLSWKYAKYYRRRWIRYINKRYTIQKANKSNLFSRLGISPSPNIIQLSSSHILSTNKCIKVNSGTRIFAVS